MPKYNHRRMHLNESYGDLYVKCFIKSPNATSSTERRSSTLLKPDEIHQLGILLDKLEGNTPKTNSLNGVESSQDLNPNSDNILHLEKASISQFGKIDPKDKIHE